MQKPSPQTRSTSKQNLDTTQPKEASKARQRRDQRPLDKQTSKKDGVDKKKKVSICQNELYKLDKNIPRIRKGNKYPERNVSNIRRKSLETKVSKKARS